MKLPRILRKRYCGVCVGDLVGIEVGADLYRGYLNAGKKLRKSLRLRWAFHEYADRFQCYRVVDIIKYPFLDYMMNNGLNEWISIFVIQDLSTEQVFLTWYYNLILYR